jgi:hypothetical protein
MAGEDEFEFVGALAQLPAGVPIGVFGQYAPLRVAEDM